MKWILFSLCGAFAQALGAAIKKKSLQTPGMNNVIGFVCFTIAGFVLGLVHWLKTGTLWRENLSPQFWQGMAGYVGLNIVAQWFLYRALDLAEFNHLMPFMTLTSLSVIVPPMLVFGEVPSPQSFAGIVLVVIGTLSINWHWGPPHTEARHAEQKARNRRGALLFVATACCFTFTPTAAKQAIVASSVLFASFVVHVFIGLGFLGLVVACRETHRLVALFTERALRKFLFGVIVAGLVIVMENASINAALAAAPVAHVMAIKRLMPLFAFVIGYLYFRERTDLRKKLIATALMMLGAILVTVYK